MQCDKILKIMPEWKRSDESVQGYIQKIKEFSYAKWKRNASKNLSLQGTSAKWLKLQKKEIK